MSQVVVAATHALSHLAPPTTPMEEGRAGPEAGKRAREGEDGEGREGQVKAPKKVPTAKKQTPGIVRLKSAKKQKSSRI